MLAIFLSFSIVFNLFYSLTSYLLYYILRNIFLSRLFSSQFYFFNFWIISSIYFNLFSYIASTWSIISTIELFTSFRTSLFVLSMSSKMFFFARFTYSWKDRIKSILNFVILAVLYSGMGSSLWFLSIIISIFFILFSASPLK